MTWLRLALRLRLISVLSHPPAVTAMTTIKVLFLTFAVIAAPSMVRAGGLVNDDALAKGYVISRDYENFCSGHFKGEIVAQLEQLAAILSRRLIDTWSERMESARAEIGREAWCEKAESLARELGMTVEPDLRRLQGRTS